MQGETCYCNSGKWWAIGISNHPTSLMAAALQDSQSKVKKGTKKPHFWKQEATHPAPCQVDFVKCPWELCSLFRTFVLLVDQRDFCWLDLLFTLSHLKKAKIFSTLCHTTWEQLFTTVVQQTVPEEASLLLYVVFQYLLIIVLWNITTILWK